jgi:hypothetical protein
MSLVLPAQAQAGLDRVDVAHKDGRLRLPAGGQIEEGNGRFYQPHPINQRTKPGLRRSRQNLRLRQVGKIRIGRGD